MAWFKKNTVAYNLTQDTYLNDRERKLVDYLLSIDNSESMDSLSAEEKGLQFEIFLKELFELSGYDVRHVALDRKTGDGGIDLLISKDGKPTVIQAKYTKAENTSLLGIELVRNVLGTDGYIRYQNAAIITTNYFTEQAKNEAIGKNIDLIDKEGLYFLITNLQPKVIASFVHEKTIDVHLGRCEYCKKPKILRYNQKIDRWYRECVDYKKCIATRKK